MKRGATRFAVVVMWGITLWASPSRAERNDERLEQAKSFFRRGVGLLDTGDTEGALRSFQSSHDLVPSVQNTINAAICLERLGRYDEALDAYDEVLARFAGELDEQDRTNIGPVMTELENHLGHIELRSNVDGAITIDDRLRGTLPLRIPLRVLPGARRLRVERDGYYPIARRVEIVAGKTLALDVRLDPISPSEATTTRGRPSPWALPAVLAGGAFAAGGAAVIVITSLSLSGERQSLAANCVVVDGDECRSAIAEKQAAAQKSVDRIATLRNVRWVGIGGAALGVGALAVGIFDLVTHRTAAGASRHVVVRIADRSVLAGWRTSF